MDSSSVWQHPGLALYNVFYYLTDLISDLNIVVTPEFREQIVSVLKRNCHSFHANWDVAEVLDKIEMP
jgi:hypothetical protein